MTPQQLVGLGLRLLAIWLAINSFRYFVLIPTGLESLRVGESAAQSYFIASGYGVGAILLWLFPMWTAHQLLPRTKYENTINLQPWEIARVGCALIGLWLFSQGILDAVWFLFRILLVRGSNSAIDSFGQDAKVDFVVLIANCILGAALIFRAGLFAGLATGTSRSQKSQEEREI